jgi:toxin ParE1/3/4
MASLTWSDKAVRDLENIYDYIATDSPFYAKIQIERIIAATGRLGRHPKSGRRIPELPHFPHQELICGAYRIIFRYEQDSKTVFIVTVVHSARLMKDELLE